MNTSDNDIRITVHAEQRRQERRVTTQSLHQAVTHGKAVRSATGWRYVGPDGSHVITDRPARLSSPCWAGSSAQRMTGKAAGSAATGGTARRPAPISDAPAADTHTRHVLEGV